MRRGKRAPLRANAWLFGLAVPAVVLFVLFSLMPYERMVASWPLGIKAGEVMQYQRFFDRRPGQHAEGQAEAITLEGIGGGCEGGALRFEGLGYSGEVQAAPAAGGGWVLTFPPEQLFGGRRSVVVVPASLRSLRAKYAQVIADSLGLLGPEVLLTRVTRCGKDLGPFLVQERITEEFVRREAPFGHTLQGADSTLGPGDPHRLAAWALMACGEERADLVDAPALAQDTIGGAIIPLYAMRAAVADTAHRGAFRSVLASTAIVERLGGLAQRLRADSAAWSARLLAIDSVWVPVLAQGRNIGLVQAEVDRGREELLHRLFHPDPARMLGATVPAASTCTIVLDPWLKPFLTEPDTLRFYRGKYAIDHDLILPEGMALVLEKGTRWNLAPGVRVQVNGELHIRGTALNPVFLRPDDPAAPYGTLAVNGDGRTRCRIRGLRMSGGSEARIGNVHHAGMLSLHGVDLQLVNSEIEEAFGPAAVEVASGGVLVQDCTFSGAHQGTLDLARVEGTVERCTFTSPTASGPAVRMNACTVLVRNCTWTEARPVALAAGHRTRALVLGGTFTKGGTAIAATDSAAVHVDGSTFTGNATVFSLRRVHPELGGAVLVGYANTYDANGKQEEVDAASRLGTADKRDPIAWSWFGLRP